MCVPAFSNQPSRAARIIGLFVDFAKGGIGNWPALVALVFLDFSAPDFILSFVTSRAAPTIQAKVRRTLNRLPYRHGYTLRMQVRRL
jgi:hypothetical protein